MLEQFPCSFDEARERPVCIHGEKLVDAHGFIGRGFALTNDQGIDYVRPDDADARSLAQVAFGPHQDENREDWPRLAFDVIGAKVTRIGRDLVDIGLSDGRLTFQLQHRY